MPAKAPARPKKLPVADADRHSFTLNDDQILKLAKWGMIIEEHYQRPMDIEWAFDGERKELFIVQARPETVQARKDAKVLEEFVMEEKKAKFLPGRGSGRQNRPGQGALY